MKSNSYNLSSSISNFTTYAGAQATALKYTSEINASYIYKYGSATKSAAELTAENSARMMKIASRAKVAGTAAALIGGAISVYQYSHNQISGYELTADLIVTGIGIIFPGAGTVISIGYFGIKALYEYQTGKSLFPKPAN